MSSTNLPPLFGHCMSCLTKAAAYLTAQGHPDALKLSLIRLRLSRWYKVTVRETLPSRDVQVVEAAVNKLWNMLGDARGAASADVPRKLLVDKIDRIVNARLPIAAPASNYQGHVFWSADQYRMASGIIGELENIIGPLGLRDLSHGEIREIGLQGADRIALEDASKEVDPWMKAIFDNLRGSSDRITNRGHPFGHGYGGNGIGGAVTGPRFDPDPNRLRPETYNTNNN